MKKLLSLVLVAVLLSVCVVLSSCDDMLDGIIDGSDAVGSELGDAQTTDDETTPVLDPMKMEATELFAIIKENVGDIEDNYTTVAEQQISTVNEGVTVTMTQNVCVKVDGKNVYFATTGVESAEMEFWYLDGLCYMDLLGSKIKYTVNENEVNDELASMGIGTEAGITAIPAEWLKDVETKKDDKGFYLEVEVSGEKFSQIYSAMGLGGEIVGDVNYKIYFDGDFYPISEVMEYDMLMEGFTFKVVSEQKIVEVGNTTVSAPSDPAAFEDMSEEVNGRING